MGAARYPPAPAPVPGAAGWIVAAGVSVSLHILALTGLLLGQPQAPAASSTGLVIKTLPPVTGSAPTLSRPDLARPAGRAADSPARDRLTALEKDQASLSAQAPETRASHTQAPRDRAARVAAAPVARGSEIRRVAPSTRPTATRPRQVPTTRPTEMRPTETEPVAVPAMRPTAPSSRPDTAPARRVIPVEPRPPAPVPDTAGAAQAARDLAPRRLAPAEAPARAERVRMAAPRTERLPESLPETRPDRPEGTRPERSDATPRAARRLAPAEAPDRAEPARMAATRAESRAETRPETLPEHSEAPRLAARRLAPAAADRPTPPPASILAPTQRLATATRPRRQSAPAPQDTRDPASRARRDGPDRRLSDRQAAPATADEAAARSAIAAALDALRSLAGTPCHTAQPLTWAGAAPAIAVFGPDRARLAEARQPDPARSDAGRPDPDWPDTASRPVTQAQCPALDFIRGAGDDPTEGISLDLWSPTAGDRQPLTGVIGHDGPPALHLLLIDTSGQVHDLQGFLYPVPDGSQFSVPMTGAGDAGDHHQLLLAIAAPAALPLPEARTPPAGPFFETLQATLARQGITPDLALAGFVFD